MALSPSDRGGLLDRIGAVTLRLTRLHSTKIDGPLRNELRRLVILLRRDARVRDRRGDASRLLLALDDAAPPTRVMPTRHPSG